MSEKLKRRRLSRYLYFPLILAMLLFVAAKLVALQRADLIAHLANRIAHAETAQAQAAVRQLAAIPDPPVAELVKAAVSPNRAVAQEAQHSIGEILRSVQQNIDAERRHSASARQLAALANSLVHHQRDFLAVDHEWLGRTTRRLIRVANRVPIESTPLVASQCDALLASIGDIEIGTTRLASAGNEGSAAGEVTEVAIGAPSTNLRESYPQAFLEERYAARASRSFPALGDSAGADSSTAEMHEAMLTPVAERSGGSPSDSVPRSMGNSAWHARWTHPMFFPMPAVPIETAPLPMHDSQRGGNPLRSGAMASPRSFGGNEIEFSEVDSRELLTQWLTATGAEIELLEQELARRGFGRLSRRLVEQFCSADIEDRLRLVDGVLAEPGVDARPWLMLLAEDPSADVRLMIVTIMATSNDPELVEKAWEVAVHDRDPRVTSLADRLRERRAASQSF